MENKKIICWWSGGITSAVACKVAIDLYGKENCSVIMIDTRNEDEDTYRFFKDCEKWFGLEIKIISGIPNNEQGRKNYEFVNVGYEYDNIQDVWEKHKSLNVATGAICSTQLKRRVREKWQEANEFDYQVFGFEFDKKEFNRALGLTKNHPKAKSIYPLLMMGYDKDDCLKIVQDAGIDIPRMYKLGFRNNNCFKTGCVQGGIGYWQKMEREFPDKFNAMAEMEHKLTALRGEPVTMLKDQSNEVKAIVEESGIKWKQFIFLKKHPKYPELKCLADMKPQEVKPLFECNGFCGTNDLNPRVETENEINFDTRDI
jgi:3'-phosphoadenosine 5'-phosphosulfate sulfotransferase (PAPS reductase)/FAD synthetase